MNDEYQTRQFFNMKKSELKQIIKEEIRKVLNENEPPEPVAYNNGFNLYDTKEDFEKALDYYWGKDKEDWELIDYNEKYGGGEIGDHVSYTIGNFIIGSWNVESKHPGGVNTNTGSGEQDLVYPKHSRKD